MKTCYLLPALLLLMCHASAQKLDSIKYTNGYLYYHTYGEGEPVIILSGGPGNSCLQQQEVAIALSKNYRSILLEQRGTGLSIPSPFDSTTINMQAALEDLTRLLDQLAVKSAVIYGHSWGAMLAMSFAAKYPQRVKALVLACPGYYKYSVDLFTTHMNNLRVRLGEPELARFDSLAKRMNDGKANAADSTAYIHIMRLSYIYDKSRIDSLLKKINIAKSNTAMAELMIGDLKRISYDLSKTLHRYKGPVEVISGSQDALAFYTYELKVIHPSAELHWIQASGHFPMFEQPEAFYAKLSAIMHKMVK